MNSVQFFLGSPYSFIRKEISFDDITQAKKLLKRFPLAVFSHYPYVANLAGSIKNLAWSGNTEQDNKTTFLAKQIEYELSVLSNFDINGVVIHPGSYPNRKLGLNAIATTINKINFVKNSKLLLENAAGEGTKLATTFEEIQKILSLIDNNKQKHVGVCIDTAHIHGVGEYDLSKVSEVKRMFHEFDSIIGPEKFSLLHLNDSQVPLKSKTDRHACIGTGYIWGESIESLYYLLETCHSRNIPIVLETHGLDMLTLGSISDTYKNKND